MQPTNPLAFFGAFLIALAALIGVLATTFAAITQMIPA
jgi:hypothetical protein